MKAASAARAAAFADFTGFMPPYRRVTAEPPSGSAVSAVDSAVLGGQAVPVLPCADLDHALNCYRYLGFSVLGRTADYLRLALGPVELHLFLDPALDALRNGAGCYLRVSDPVALRTAWAEDGVNCLDLPGTGAYGSSLFAVIDTDGNTLRFGPLSHRAEHSG